MDSWIHEKLQVVSRPKISKDKNLIYVHERWSFLLVNTIIVHLESQLIPSL